MKCPYCAESIQDEAVLCRFCGAQRTANAWSAPNAVRSQAPSQARTNLTIATTGLLLLLSGAWSLATLTAPVPLFGARVAGLRAALYNGAFGGLLLAMGYALVRRRPWALSVTWLASLVYTFDKLELILDPAARESALGESSELLGELLPVMQQVVVAVALLFLLGWWAFVAYLYLKRAYFFPARQDQAA